MRPENIIWGGNNKCEFTINKSIALSEGMLIDINYDYTSTKYILKSQDEEAAIELDDYNKRILDNIYLTGDQNATLVRIIDKDDDTYIVEVKVFRQRIQFNKLQAISIQIGDDIIDKMRIRDKDDPIAALNRDFKFNDMVFVKGYGRKGASFSILSCDRFINVRQADGLYVATNHLRYDRNQADYDTVYILQGELTFTNSSKGAHISGEVAAKMARITSSGQYFDIWDAYNDLDTLFAMKQTVEAGVLEYKSCSYKLTDAFEYCFDLDGVSNEAFPNDAMIECTDDENIKLLDQMRDKDFLLLKQIRKFTIGTFDRIEGNKCYIIDRQGSSQKKLPSQGFLLISMAGDAVRLARRESAKSIILRGEALIGGLAEMIESGAELNKRLISETPITKKLERKFPKYKFNDEQREAIEVAINTPDIALILGPPGTGKTTVIKAIIARYEEYFHKQNQEIPKILVTSFQHEAVENAIVGVDGNGVPSDRRGGKNTGKEKQRQNVLSWREDTTKTIETRIAELIPYGFEVGNTLRDKIYAWKEKGKDPAEGIELLKESYVGYRLQLSERLNEDINNVLSRAAVGMATDEKLKDIESEQADEVEQILLAQRLTLKAYEDDGKKQAYRLKYAIEMDEINNGGNSSFVDAVLATKGKDENAFKIYVSEVQRLKEKLLRKKNDKTAVSDILTIEQCLKGVASELEEIKRHRLENREEATAYVLQNYIESIQDEKEIERIIEKYSNIVAATCQQAMEVGRFARNVEYDLVIVDEAARANPLDLLIPMSMGKKVILVGDHKQLPHMLDPEVVKSFENDEKKKDLGVLQESMFERLFKFYDHDSLQIKRTARLSKQYRMHPSIGEYASDCFYTEYPLDSKLVKVEEKTANIGDKYNRQPMAWINLDKNDFGMEDGKRSYFREEEAKRIIEEVRDIFRIDSSKKIGIISFYRSQAELIQKMAETEFSDRQNEHLEVGTVDAFQGKEFDIVFLSCVRANTFGLEDMRHRVGHVNDMSRLCVALTRARQLVVAVGDRDTVECIAPIGEFIRRCEKGDSYIE